jgi:hypothetical protein
MEPTLGLAISGVISLSSLLSVTYLAGRYSEKINRLENSFAEIILDLKEIQKELHNVQRELSRITGQQQNFPRSGLPGSSSLDRTIGAT